jgi:hypothetical protein
VKLVIVVRKVTLVSKEARVYREKLVYTAQLGLRD